MPKKIRFIDPTEEYAKPYALSITVHGQEEYKVLETVLHSLMDTMGFVRNGGEILDNAVRFDYRQKGKRK